MNRAPRRADTRIAGGHVDRHASTESTLRGVVLQLSSERGPLLASVGVYPIRGSSVAICSMQASRRVDTRPTNPNL
jgi:hypothetical protein